MKHYAIFLILIILGITTGCQQPPHEPETVFLEDPLIAVAHGVFLAADGREVVPDRAFIARAQRFYIEALLDENERGDTRKKLDGSLIDDTENAILELVDDDIFARSLYLDWLIESMQPIVAADLTNKNAALRWHYYLNILGRQNHGMDAIWMRGIPRDIAERLERRGVQVMQKINSSGREYRAACREAGVPVPEGMFTSEWTSRGIINNVFISAGSEAELWMHTSTSPAGVCLALPRYPFASGGGASNQASLLGIICLGTQTNKACYFDNPRGVTFARDVPVGIDQFIGGVDLVTNGQGVCTDCHAGENPFVVHPDRSAFAGLTNTLMPAGWTDPLVAASWPQNPGPTNVLDAVSSPGACDSCHQAGVTGRFPDVSTVLPGYCSVILNTAVSAPPQGSMPPGGGTSAYSAHITALQQACSAPPEIGVVVEVDQPDDRSFLSPPQVIGPLYQCATRVSVRGAFYGAEVTLSINGSDIDSLIATSPYQETFKVPELVAGDIVTARQRFQASTSGESPSEPVRDHLVDYPGGLPAPDIDPTLIYECASLIAVRHVPGATVQVLTNGGDPVTRLTSIAWSMVRPGKTPFDVGDGFVANQSLCDDRSPPSAVETATNAPVSPNAPAFDPPQPFVGQQIATLSSLTHGAKTEVSVSGTGALGSFSTPISWYPDFDIATPLGRPLAAGESLSVTSHLCDAGPTATSEPAGRCESLPAPRIRTPIVGDQHVVVTDSIPGARIRIYDQTADELGDGSGTVILLKRGLTGADTLTVIQQLGECVSRTGYRISVRNPDWKREQ